MTNLKNQQVLIDTTRSGKSRFWSERKTHNLLLSEAYKTIDVRKSGGLASAPVGLCLKNLITGKRIWIGLIFVEFDCAQFAHGAGL